MLFVGVFFSACLICAIFVLPKILGRIFNKTGRARMARFFWWLVKIALLAVAVCLIFVHPFVAAIWVAVIVGDGLPCGT